jgi:N-acetylneuraminic acid mutarotase
VNAAAAVDLNHQEYIIGGESGQTPQSTIWDYSAAGSGQVNQRGTLTDASYGIGAAVIGNSVYIVGGYTGAANLKTIFAWTPGSPPTLVGKLPVGLRYAAVAAIDNELIIAGGATATGVSKQVYVFNPANKSVHAIAQLPTGLEWAAAATLGDLVYVIGGEPGSGKTPVTTIYSIDPIGKQHVANAGTLPSPLAEAAMVKVGSTIYLSGGWNGTAAVTTVLALTAKAS